MSTIKLPFAVQFTVPDKIEQFSADQLDTVRTLASETAQPLLAKGTANLSAEERQTFIELGQVASAAMAEQNRRAAAAEKEAAQVADAEAAFAAATPATVTAEPALVGAGATSVAAAPAATFAAGPAPVAPAVVEPPARAGEVAGTAAAPAIPATPAEDQIFGRFQWAAKLGLESFSGLHQMADQLVRRVGGYNGFTGEYSKDPFLVFQRDYPEALRGPAEGAPTGEANEFALLESAAKGWKEIVENQTAAAGYCAPSLTLYELCELETSAGILPITELQISRGGIFFTTGPDFASIFNGSGYWNLTEAQIIASTVKPCMEIPCPPFTEKRLVNLGLCITGGILQRRGYPELVARFIRGAMIAHLHRINAFVIAQIAAGSTLVDFDPVPVGTLVNDTTSSGVLAALAMVALDIRSRNRMDPQANIEVVAPTWVIEQFRADVSRRTGVDMISVPDAEIMSWFSDRNLTLRLVYDWQDAFSGVAAGPGAAAPGMTTFPSAVEFLLYPPGTWVKGVDDTIRLETVYDSTKLSTNQYTALFTEEGVLVAQTCPDSRRLVYPFCPTGATSELVTRSCS